MNNTNRDMRYLTTRPQQASVLAIALTSRIALDGPSVVAAYLVLVGSTEGTY